MEWRDIPVFISSTFNDMHAERDYLVKYVFPELAEWCTDRRLRLIDIDLRWGVTKEESETNNVLRKCLENIEDCRPFFLCLIGQRRGWAPNDPLRMKYEKEKRLSEGNPALASEISDETIQKYPGVKELDSKNSVTEIEIEHALLKPLYYLIEVTAEDSEDNRMTGEACENAVFFERNCGWIAQMEEANASSPQNIAVYKRVYTNNDVLEWGGNPKDADAAILETKAKILEKRPIYEYSCTWRQDMQTPELAAEYDGEILSGGRLTGFTSEGAQWKDIVIEKLKAMILSKFGDREEPYTVSSDTYRQDLEQQELFAYSVSEGYISRTDIEGELNKYLTTPAWRKPCLVTAKAGLGKTTLLAHYLSDAENIYDKQHGIFRFCGASDLSADAFTLWDSICRQAGVTPPGGRDELQQNLSRILYDIAEKGYTHIIIDAVNQMSDGVEMLSWIPPELPDSLKLVLSAKTTDGDAVDPKFVRCLITEMDDSEVKMNLIDQFLRRYLKTLDAEQKAIICGLQQSNNPLFLKILLHELHFFGSYRQLSDEIKRYKNSPKEAFAALLERLETESFTYDDVYNAEESAPFLFGLLSQARGGLSEDETTYCFGKRFNLGDETSIHATIRFLLRQVRPFLARRSGRIDFLYESFKEASIERYNDGSEELNAALADCFLKQCDKDGDGSFDGKDGRALIEYAYHLSKCDPHSSRQLYQNIPYLSARCSYSSIAALLREMEAIEECEENKRLIFRHKERLSEYKNSLPSLLYFCGDSLIKERIERMQADGVLRKTWIKSEQAALVKSSSVPPQSLSCETTGKYSLKLPTAYCLAKIVPIAVVSRGNNATFINTDSLEEYNGAIYADEAITSLAISNNGIYVAVGFDGGRGNVYKAIVSGTTVSAAVVQAFEFLPTEEDAGIFAFEEEQALWYSDDEGRLTRMSLDDGEKRRFAEGGEITSLCVGTNYVCFTEWNPQNSSAATVSLSDCSRFAQRSDCSRFAQRIFEEDDIQVFCADCADNFIIGSLRNKSGYAASVVGADLKDRYSSPLKEPLSGAAFCGEDTAVLVPQCLTMDATRLMDFTHNETNALQGRIEFVRGVKIKRNAEGDFTLISALALVRFGISEKLAEAPERISDVLVNAGSLFRASIDSTNTLQLFVNEQKYFLKSNAQGERHRIYIGGDRIVVTDDPNGTYESLLPEISEIVTPDYLENAVSILSGSEVVYFKSNSLFEAPHSLIERYPDYTLSIARLFAFSDYVALSGVIGGDLRRRTHSPYVLFVYKKAGEGYRKIMERYFDECRLPIEDVSYNEESDRLYVLFGGAQNDFNHPSCAYGSLHEFITEKERYKTLCCPKIRLSAATGGRNYCVCGDGVLIANNEEGEYATALFSDEPIRFVRKSEKREEYIAVGGNENIFKFSVIN